MSVMKYLCSFIVLLALITVPFAAGAQCPSNKGQFEIAISHGFITGDQLADEIKARDNESAGSGGKSETYNSGATFVTLRYFFFNRLALGIASGMNSVKGQYTDSYNPSLITSTFTQSNTTVAAELYYIYFFRKYLEVYTLFGIGPQFSSTNTTVNANAYTPESSNRISSDVLKLQYTPLGVRIGGRIGAFAELGIGYKGIFNVGASFRLGPSCWWH